MSTPPDPSITFDIPESDLVHRLGVSRNTVRGFRSKDSPIQLLRDVHWVLAGRSVMWSAEGATFLATALQLPARENPVPKSEAPPVETLTVTSRPTRQIGPDVYHFGNRQLIRARRPGGDEVFVRVPDSSRFTTHLACRGPAGELIPMTILARFDGTAWQLAQKAPRWRGRW